MHSSILLERLWSILLRLEGDRIKEDVATNPVPKQLLNLDEVRRDHRTNPFTVRVHEVDNHDLVFDQVIIEPDLLAFVRGQNDIGEIALPDYLARRGCVLFRVLTGRARRQPA